METPQRFWQGMSKAASVALLDKIMIGVNADGSTKYGDVNQIVNLLSVIGGASFKGNITPDSSPVISITPVFYVAIKGTYPNFGGKVVTGAAAIIGQVGTEFTVSNFDIDLVDYAKKIELPADLTQVLADPLSSALKIQHSKNTGLLRKLNQKFYFGEGGHVKYLPFNGSPHFFVYNLFYQNENETVNLAPEPLTFQISSDYAILCVSLADTEIFLVDSSDVDAWESLQTDPNFGLSGSVVLAARSKTALTSTIPCVQGSLDLSIKDHIRNPYADKYQFDFGVNSDFTHNFTDITQVNDGLEITGGSTQGLLHKRKSNSKEHNFSVQFKIVETGTVYLITETELSNKCFAQYNTGTGFLQVVFAGFSSNVTFVSEVNDWIKLSLKFYYDSYYLEVENLTTGGKSSTKINITVNAAMGGLLPISAQAGFFVDSGKVILKEFSQFDLLNERDIETTFVGDSISSLYYVGNRENSYQFLVYAGKENQMSTVAWAGGTVANLKAHIADIIRMKPKFATCYIGTNDEIQNTPLSDFESNYSFILSKLVSAGIQPVLCDLPIVNGVSPTDINSVIFKLHKRFATHMVFLSDAGLILSDFDVDEVHPVASGAVKIANAIKAVYNSIL